MPARVAVDYPARLTTGSPAAPAARARLGSWRQFPKRYRVGRQRAPAVALGISCLHHQLGAAFVGADDLATVEQQDQTHRIKPRVRPIRVAAEHVELRPPAPYRFSRPAAYDDPPP